jgi:hypothetical protein
MRLLGKVSMGVVTRTLPATRNFGRPILDSCRGSSSPCPERFVSEDAERAAGCEMALDVECVVNNGVN